jgi:hypothetical protein
MEAERQAKKVEKEEEGFVNWQWDSDTDQLIYGYPPDAWCAVYPARSPAGLRKTMWTFSVYRNNELEKESEDDYDFGEAKDAALAHLFLGPDLKGRKPTQEDIDWGLEVYEELRQAGQLPPPLASG